MGFQEFPPSLNPSDREKFSERLENGHPYLPDFGSGSLFSGASHLGKAPLGARRCDRNDHYGLVRPGISRPALGPSYTPYRNKTKTAILRK